MRNNVRGLLVLWLLGVVGCSGAGDAARPSTTGSGGGGDSPGGFSGGRGEGPNEAGAMATIHVDASGLGADSAAGSRAPLDSCPSCTWVDCPSGAPTTLSGTVYAPAETNPDPLYNAVVYVPGAQVDAFTPGVSCDKCGNVSGHPVAAALSDASGKFKMDKVPVGHDVPLVVQLGRWRRQVRIPEVKACADNPLPPELTRFPRDHTEGDIPQMAVVSSEYDPVECILRKIGIKTEEFTLPTGTGRVHFLLGAGATMGPGTPPGRTLWDSAETLKPYDMVLFPCASTPERADGEQGDAARLNVMQYANLGGRVFVTDLSSTWISDAPAPFNKVANWTPSSDVVLFNPLPEKIDTSFPKGQALANWLENIGATATMGNLDVSEPYWRVDTVNTPAQRWLYADNVKTLGPPFPGAGGPSIVQSFTFNTPADALPADQCGRVLYSSFHIANEPADNSIHFPNECNDQPLTPQERVLEFMLFDLASCVQIDTEPPQPPVNIR